MVQGAYLLNKFPGKGGWTYAEIPQIAQNPKNPFGWVKVKGNVDGIHIKTKLMPMGNGRLFLPVKAALRKQLNKKEGDEVYLELEEDKDELFIPEEIMQCFKAVDITLFQQFDSLSADKKDSQIKWIMASSSESTKVERINKLMEKLSATVVKK